MGHAILQEEPVEERDRFFMYLLKELDIIINSMNGFGEISKGADARIVLHTDHGRQHGT